MKKKEKEKEQFNPLKKVKKSSESKSTLISLQADSSADAIDEFARLDGEIKHLKGEQESHKLPILTESKLKFAERIMAGHAGNIKLVGNEHTINYIVQNSSSQLTESDLLAAEEKFGKKTISDLVTVDLSSLKFNPEFIDNEAVQKKIFAALEKAFPPEDLENMFLPVSNKVVDDVLERSAKHVKSKEDLIALYDLLKIKNYIKA